jgi:hypothetical protein
MHGLTRRLRVAEIATLALLYWLKNLIFRVLRVFRYATRLLYISWRDSNPPIDYSGGSEWNASSTGEYKSRGLYSSSLVASEQTVMRKREHAGFVTPIRLISLPNRVKSVIA